MNDELTNLLPLDRQKTLRHRYFMRVSATVFLLATAVIGATAVLLFPTYVVLSQNEANKKAILNSATTALSSADEEKLSARLIILTNSAKKLSALGTESSISSRFSTLLAVSHTGVTLSGMSYTKTAPPKSVDKPTLATLTVSGTAATRDTLRAYQLALQTVPFVATAVLPVSAYAQSTSIPFTITLTLTP